MDQATAYALTLRRISNGTRAYALSRIPGSLWEMIGAEGIFDWLCDVDHGRYTLLPVHFAHGHENT